MGDLSCAKLEFTRLSSAFVFLMVGQPGIATAIFVGAMLYARTSGKRR